MSDSRGSGCLTPEHVAANMPAITVMRLELSAARTVRPMEMPHRAFARFVQANSPAHAPSHEVNLALNIIQNGNEV